MKMCLSTPDLLSKAQSKIPLELSKGLRVTEVPKSHGT